MVKKINNIIIDNIYALLISFTLLMTQYFYKFQNKIYISYTEIIMLFLWAFTFIFLIKKSKMYLNNDLKKIIKIVIAFITFFIFLLIYWSFTLENLNGVYKLFRTIMLPIIIVFIPTVFKINKRQLILSIIIFLTYISKSQIKRLYFGSSFRELTGLGNINIYLCFIIMILPILINVLSNLNKTNKIFYWIGNIIIWINITLSAIISLLSGSRISFVLYPLVFFLSFFNNFKIRKKTILSFIVFSLLIGFFCTLAYRRDYNGARDSINRSFFTIVEKSSVINFMIGKFKLPDTIPSRAGTNAINSDLMRKNIQENTIKTIKENFLFGVGNTDIKFKATFIDIENFYLDMVQSPHNFILELLISIGIIGLAFYLYMIINIILIIIKKHKNDKKEITNFFLIIGSTYFYSFYEPLITVQLAISFIFWIIIAIYFNKEKEPVI